MCIRDSAGVLWHRADYMGNFCAGKQPCGIPPGGMDTLPAEREARRETRVGWELGSRQDTQVHVIGE
eukprot:2376237-Pyramimonas_sp.AAC.1